MLLGRYKEVLLWIRILVCMGLHYVYVLYKCTVFSYGTDPYNSTYRWCLITQRRIRASIVFQCSLFSDNITENFFQYQIGRGAGYFPLIWLHWWYCCIWCIIVHAPKYNWILKYTQCQRGGQCNVCILLTSKYSLLSWPCRTRRAWYISTSLLSFTHNLSALCFVRTKW